jgi:hypothetical protein
VSASDFRRGVDRGLVEAHEMVINHELLTGLKLTALRLALRALMTDTVRDEIVAKERVPQ